jgi:putative hydrolase of the HAD superfamily
MEWWDRMDIRAIAFDVNGTLVDIETHDDMEQIFRAIGHFLTYQGIDLRRHRLRDLYFEVLKEQQRSSPEAYPEFDSVGIWRQILESHATDFTRRLPPEKWAQMPLFLAEMYRGISRRRLRLYPNVREVLDQLRGRLPLAVVTDAQHAYAKGELHKVGILDYFDPIVVSGDHGFRKPDPRLFRMAAEGMGSAPEHTLFVGNDMFRDIYGAREAGMRTVMFNSNQGAKYHEGCSPDFTISDHRDLLGLLDS